MNREIREVRERSKVDDPLSKMLIGAAIEVDRTLGPGLLESAYEDCLCHELSLRKVAFKRQVSLPLRYKGVSLDGGFRVDILIPEQLVVELKAVDKLLPIHSAQVITYLKLTGICYGLLLNFNVASLRQGIRRLRYPQGVMPMKSNPPRSPDLPVR